MFRRSTHAFAAAALLAGAACGPRDARPVQAADASTTSSAGQAAVTEAGSQKSIAGIAAGSADHTTLVAALKAANLLDALANPGPLTVFAPVNAAFDKLPEAYREVVLLVDVQELAYREAAEVLRKHHPAKTEILPLFSRLSAEEQDRVFEPSGRRRVVLSTNVAETSLTVPGIHYVIDTGLARVKRFSPRQKIDQLRIEPISQAAARQRSGRCGRVASGVAIRLYSEENFAGRPAQLCKPFGPQGEDDLGQ